MNINYFRRAGCLIALLVLTAGLGNGARGQVPDAQTGTASPGRATDQLRIPQDQLRTVPKVEIRELRLQDMPEGAGDLKFALTALTLEGATVYGGDELAAVYGDKVGTVISLADLYDIAARLTAKYRNDGYILTQVVVPPQTIDTGEAKLQVVEGYVGSVRLEGADAESAASMVRNYAAYIDTSGSPLNSRELERALLLINDLPGVSARGILSPAKDRPGAAELLIVLERDPFDGLVGIDNYGSKFLGPLQVRTAGSLNGILGANERITAQIAVAPDRDFERELSYLGLAYEQPVGPYGTKARFGAEYTATDPGHTLRPFDVEGRSQLFSVGLEHPFIRSRVLNLYGRALLDYRKVRTSNNIEIPRKDKTRVFRLGGHLEFLDTLFNAGFNSIDLEISKGLQIFGATDDRDPDVSRPGAEADFIKMNAELQRLQRLGAQVNLLLAATGQWADDGLFSSEEFGIGGMNAGYGRGFDPSEIIGDSGLAGKVELQWNEPYALSLLESYQIFGFYDAGRVWNTDPTANAFKTDTVTSTGFGIRADFSADTAAALTVAVPLNRSVQTMNDRDPRVFVSLVHRF